MANIAPNGGISSNISSIGVANQLRFLTLQQNGSIQAAAQNKTAIETQPALNTLTQDTVNFSTDKFAADDGKISAKDKLINFGKGAIYPVTAMFSSPKNFIIGAGGIIGGGLLIAATGGAIAPIMVVLGITGGAIGLIKNGYSAMNAKTDDEARKAWQGLGLNSTVTIGSIAGSKAALKGAGIDTKNMNIFAATVECFKKAPAQTGKAFTAFKSGQALNNIKNAFHIKKKDTKTPENNVEPPTTEGDRAVKPQKNNIEQQTTAMPDKTPANTGEAITQEAAMASKGPIEGSGTSGETRTPAIKKANAPKKPHKPKRKRPSRIKHEVSAKQAEQVRKEVKSITAILDDFAADNNIDPQFRQKIEDVRSIAQHPMENPKSDIESLIGTIKQLESCRDNPETIAINGKNVDFPFDDAISYVENLLKEYGIDRLTTAAGDAFDGKIMSALEFEHTSNPARNDTVFKMLFSGFKKQEKKVPPSSWKIKVIKYTTEN